MRNAECGIAGQSRPKPTWGEGDMRNVVFGLLPWVQGLYFVLDYLKSWNSQMVGPPLASRRFSRTL
jgi:hypothetical protein